MKTFDQKHNFVNKLNLSTHARVHPLLMHRGEVRRAGVRAVGWGVVLFFFQLDFQKNESSKWKY